MQTNILSKLPSAREIVDMRVKSDMSLIKIKEACGLSHQHYVANYIAKLKNQDPPFEGYEPFDKNEVIEWLQKDNLSLSEVAAHFGITEDSLMAYCKLYDVDVCTTEREKAKS